MQKYIFFLLASSLLFLFTGCASTRDMARVNNSLKAEGQFLNENPSSYNFYYYSEGGKTIAYLALDKKYILQSKFWYKTDMNAALWIDAFRETDFPYGEYDDFQGKEIVSSGSEIIGYVITRYYWVTAWFTEPGSTVITIPPPSRSGSQRDPHNWPIDRL